MNENKKKIIGIKILYKLMGLSPLDSETTKSLSDIANDKSISCGEGLWMEDGIIVTPCPIAAQNYNDSYLHAEVGVKKIPIFG